MGDNFNNEKGYKQTQLAKLHFNNFDFYSSGVYTKTNIDM